LTQSSKDDANLRRPTDTKQISGIDIGTGASCIYPLLGKRIYNWSFLATDIDPVSLEYATKNIAMNNWEDKIETRLATEGNILSGVIQPEERFDFCMCNPPFFSDLSETGLSDKTVCTGTSGELVTQGGEQEFVAQIIEDSLVMKDQIKWYTSMLGRKASLKPLLSLLQKRRIVNTRTTEFFQGRTTRWGIAWSFSQDGLEDMVKTKVAPVVKQISSFSVDCDKPILVIRAAEKILNSLKIKFSTDPNISQIKGQVYHESWKSDSAPTGTELLFAFEIQLLQIQPKKYLLDCKFKGGKSKDSLFSFVDYLKSSLSSFIKG